MNTSSFFFNSVGAIMLTLLLACNEVSKAQSPHPPVCSLEQETHYNLRPFLQILADSSVSYTIDDIVTPRMQARFEPFKDHHIDIQAGQRYWGKIQVENRLPNADAHREWVLNLSETFTQVTLYWQSENGTWLSERNGSFMSNRDKSFAPTRTGNWFKRTLLPQTVVTLYFKGESEYAAITPTFQAYIQPADTFYEKLLEAKLWSTLFAGFLVTMLFYNLLTYFFARDSSYLFYTGYLLMVLAYTAYSAHNIEDWMGGFLFVEHPAYFAFFKLSIFLGLMCYLAFIRSFLDLEHLLPKWDRYFRYLTWLGIPMMAIFWWLTLQYNFSYAINDRPVLFYIATVSLSCFFFVYPLYKTKDPKGLFITAGILVISLGFLLTLYSRMTETPFTVFYLKAGTILEILIFSMGLVYRQKQHELARQRADFALRESQLLQEKKQEEANRLQELDAFKSRFFTNITHEFRTPLTVILGMAERLSVEGSRLAEREVKNSLSLIKRSGENLLRLVNQILDLAKLESNTLKMNYVQGDVLAFARYITESLHSLANAQNLLLRVESDQAKVVMDYDPERFLQIIHNLLSNAIKFTPSGGKVMLHLAVEGPPAQSLLAIRVKDNGAGIPAEEIPHLFDRFFQAKNQEHAKAGGTGIGLSLTRELVRAMGGEIAAESTVGVGSTFTVKLPITNKSAFEEKDTETWSAQSPHRPSVLPTFPDESNQHRILLIEDNPDVIEYLNVCLQGALDHQGQPYEIDFAYNGQAGIDKALDTVPDLIVSDVMMPFKDGFEVVETLKNDERTSHIPIVLLTAKADVQSRLAGLRKGADAYLSKPFHQEELWVTIDNLLETRRKLQQKHQQQMLGAPAQLAPAVVIEDAFLQKVRAVIEAHYSDEDFGLPQLCQKIGMSRSQLFKKMKALMDMAPSDLIRTHRLNKAKVLLESGAANVAEAAWEVGFKDPSYFSKLYQDAFGVAPKETRK